MLNVILIGIGILIVAGIVLSFEDCIDSTNTENSYKSYRPPRPTSKTERPKKPQEQYWKTDSDGNITILVNDGHWLKNEIIKKQDILELHDDEIKYSRIERHNNLNRHKISGYIWCNDYGSLIENKEDLVEYNTKDIWTYHYDCPHWRVTHHLEGEEFDRKITPIQEIFTNKFDGEYKLIESIEELNDYLQSSLSCDDWCRLKLINTMKSLNLGDGFIAGFADLIDNDLEKYHLMIDLTNEVKDIDTLMYMFVYKFGRKEND